MKKYKKLLIIGILICIIYYLVYYIDIGALLTFENLVTNKERLKVYVQQNYISTTLIYILIYITVVTLGIPGAAILTISGGFLFGAFISVIYINAGATIGAGVSFLLARYLIGEEIQKKHGDKLQKINKEIEVNGKSYLLTVRLIPAFPFFLINLLAGLTKVSFKTFIFTTSLGIIPGSFIYAFAGSNLAEINSVKEILSPGIVLSFVFLAILAFLPILIKKLKARIDK